MNSSNGITRLHLTRNLDTTPPSISLEITLDPTALKLTQSQLGTRVTLDGWQRTGQPGGPGLPSRTLWIALPERWKVRDLEIAERGEDIPITRQPTQVVPIRTPRRDTPDRTSSRVTTTTHVGVLFEAERKAPRPLVRLLGTQNLGACPAALVEINPVSVGVGGNLVFASALKLSLVLQEAEPRTLAAPSQPEPVSPAQHERLSQIARAVVINPEDVPSTTSLVPRDLTEHWDFVILTDDTTWNAATKTPATPISPSLVAAFNELASWKNSIGLRTRVVTVSDIVKSRAGSGFKQDFATGAADLQEAIRRFLRWAHATWGTAYVLIGGDEHVVPIRRLQIGSAWDKNLPTDLYYAALGTPNDEWKESSRPPYEGYGFDRLFPCISLGRAPASNAAEAGNFVAKIKRYEGLRFGGNGLNQPWLERILFVSTKWGGDAPTLIPPSKGFPPGGDQFALDASRARAVIGLVDTLHITQDTDRTTSSPADNCFNLVPGKTYYKIKQKVTYRNPQDILAKTNAGTLTLAHNQTASPSIPGWFYTDWLDNDGPCHDASGQNYPTAWIIVHLPAGLIASSFDLRLAKALRMDYNLLSNLGNGDYRPIPYDIKAASTKHGWYFSLSATDATPSPLDPLGHQIPTSWVSVYGRTAELSPLHFVLDPSDEADTMSEQEWLRKQIHKDMPCWDSRSALYPDVVDVPAADRGSIDLQYYTQDRLRAKLNTGQHVVSIGGHGNPWATCCTDGVGAFDTGVADALTNAPCCGIVYANSCLTNRYVDDSLSRHLVMKNAKGGAVSYIGYIDEINIALGQFFESRFFSALAGSGTLGPAVDARATLLLPGSPIEATSAEARYTMFMMALLGDPTLRIHGATRENLPVNALSVGPDFAKQLNVVYIRPDHKIAAIKQDPPQGGWTRASVIDIGSWADRLAVTPNRDGRLEVIYIGSDNKLYHIWQTAAGGAWSGSGVLDNGSFAKRVTAIPNADKRIEVIYVGSDNKLYHIWQTSPNNGWTASFVLDNGSYAKELVATQNKDGRIEVVYIGSDNKLHHIWQVTPNGSWTSSSVLDNGSYARQISAGRNKDGRIEIFYIGSDHKLYHIWQVAPNGSWTPSYVLNNGSYAKQLAVASNQDGRLEVFYIGSDDKLYHIWQAAPNGSWTPSYVLDNGSYAKQLVVDANADGRLEVFYIGSDDCIYHLWQTAPNSGWSQSFALKG